MIMSEVKRTMIGKVAHFYPKINVIVITVEAPLNVGDKILIEGKTTHLEQTVDSMQIEHANIQSVEPGQSIGLKVVDKVKEGDNIFKID